VPFAIFPLGLVLTRFFRSVPGRQGHASNGQYGSHRKRNCQFLVPTKRDELVEAPLRCLVPTPVRSRKPDLWTTSILARRLAHFSERQALRNVRWVDPWAERGSEFNAGQGYAVPGERRLHDHPRPLRALEGARRDISGAARLFGEPLPWRTLLPFS